MTLERIESLPLEFGKLLHGGTRWFNGTTWHISEPPKHGEKSTERTYDCFEVKWDVTGQGVCTGRRKPMKMAEAARTQVQRKKLDEADNL